MRDITLEDTFIHAFTTRQFSDGVPTTLAGSPVLSVLEGGNATPITAGVSVSVDRATVTGLNEATIVATAANGYESGKSYVIYISTGTVGGTSVVGEIVGEFTVASSAAAVDLANATDGLGAIKAETALIVADTNELQTDDVPGLIATLDAVVDTVKVDTAAILVDTGTSGVALLAATQASIDAIEADTNELQVDDYPTTLATLATAANLTTVDTVVDAIKAITDQFVFTTANQVDCQPISIGADAITAASMHGSASGEIADQVWNEELALHTTADTSGLVLNEWQDAGRLDVILDAIKAITDQMVFTKANELDVNTQSINGAAVVGDGNATPWDGA